MVLYARVDMTVDVACVLACCHVAMCVHAMSCTCDKCVVHDYHVSFVFKRC